MFEVDLQTALRIFDGVNKSIDVRAIVARQKNSNQCYAVFVKIRFSPQSVTEIEAMYEKIESDLKKVDYSDFKIIQMSRPIEDATALLITVQSMRIKFPDYPELFKTVGTEAQNIFENRSTRCDNFSNEEENLGFETIGIMTTTGGQHLQKVVDDLGVDHEQYVGNFERCRDWLAVDTVTTTANILVLFHVPIKKINLGEEEKDKGIAKYLVHKLFLTKLSFYGSYQRLFSSEAGYRKESDYKTMFNFEPKIVLLEESKDNFINILVCFDEGRNAEILPTDRITIRITYNGVGGGEIRADEIIGQQLLPKEPVIVRKDTLLNVFRHFNGYSKLRDMLTQGDSKQQTRSLAWSLSILDWSTIELANVGEEIRENGIIVASADILSYNPNEKILLAIDCTIRSSEADSKISSMHVIPDYIKVEAPNKVIPLIFCRQRCIPDTKTKGKNNGALVVDMADLNGIITLIESGNLDQAKTEFVALLHRLDNFTR